MEIFGWATSNISVTESLKHLKQQERALLSLFIECICYKSKNNPKQKRAPVRETL